MSNIVILLYVDLYYLSISGGKVATNEETISILKTILSKADLVKLEEMMSDNNTSLDKVVQYFLKNGHLRYQM